MKEWFCWTSHIVEAENRDEAIKKFIEAVKQKLCIIETEEE